MSTSELVINTEPTPDQVQYLEDGIYEFHSGATGITDGEWLAIFVKDERGRIVAGICGATRRAVAWRSASSGGHKNLLLRKRLGESSSLAARNSSALAELARYRIR